MVHDSHMTTNTIKQTGLMYELLMATKGQRIKAIKLFRWAADTFGAEKPGLKYAKSIQDATLLLYGGDDASDWMPTRSVPLAAGHLEPLVTVAPLVDDDVLSAMVGALCPDLIAYHHLDVMHAVRLLASPE